MKFKILLLLVFVFFQSYSQISIGPSHVGTKKNFKKGVLEKFKSTTTIFILNSFYDKAVYEQVLKDAWDVTPYKIVDLANFNVEDYLNGKYSFARLAGFEKIFYTNLKPDMAKLFTYIDVHLLDGKKMQKKLNKLSPKKKAKKMDDLFAENSSSVARFYIYPRDEFIHKAIPLKMEATVNALYTEDVFFNYKPGFLRNYFQKVNNQLKAEEAYWMYSNDYLPELKNLASGTLYIPAYMLLKFNPFFGKDRAAEDNNLDKVFEGYEYDYEIVEDGILSDRILNEEEFYYLRYVRMNAERFVQVVNSKTGEIVYRDYITGLSYNIKNKQIRDLNKSIGKTLED